MAKKIKFEEYDWDTWMKEVGSKLYFSGGNEEEALRKYKMKYFKTHVDPDFDFNLSSSSSPSSSQENLNTANKPNQNNNNNNNDNNNEKKNNNNEGGAQQRRVRRGGSGGFNLTQRIWTFASISVIMNSFLFYLPIFYWIFEWEFLEPKGAYNRALLSAVGVYLVSLSYEIGFPAFTKEYFTKFAKSENTHYVSVCLLILVLPNPIFLFLMPLALTQLFALLKVLENFPQFRKPIVQQVLEKQQYVVTYCAICEVVTFPLLFSLMIFGGGIQEAISCFVYFQFLQNRYVNNVFIRVIFQQLRVKILEITHYPIFPAFVSRSFDALCTYLYRITTHQPA